MLNILGPNITSNFFLFSALGFTSFCLLFKLWLVWNNLLCTNWSFLSTYFWNLVVSALILCSVSLMTTLRLLFFTWYFFQGLLSLHFLTVCFCSTLVIVLYVLLILLYWCNTSAILYASFPPWYLVILKVSCYYSFSLLFLQQHSFPPKLASLFQWLILYGCNTTLDLLLVFFLSPFSTFLRLTASKFSGSFIFSTILLIISCIFIRLILFYPSINNSIYFSSYIHFNLFITISISH